MEQVSPALRDIDDAIETARSQQAIRSGMIRIDAFPTAARAIMAPLVVEIVRRYPQVHVDIVTEGRLVDIVADGFDLGVREMDLVLSDVIALSLHRPQRFAVAGAPAYFETRNRPGIPTDLLQHQWIRVRPVQWLALSMAVPKRRGDRPGGRPRARHPRRSKRRPHGRD